MQVAQTMEMLMKCEPQIRHLEAVLRSVKEVDLYTAISEYTPISYPLCLPLLYVYHQGIISTITLYKILQK